MQRLQRVLIVLVCICAIALSACLGPRSAEPNTPNARATNETTETADAQANSRIEDSGNPTDRPANLDLSSEEQAKISDIAYLSGRANPAPVQERIVLLSLKYDLDRATIANVLHDYLRKHGGFKGDSNFTRTIYEIRDRYNISTQDIAQVLMDYKSWLSLNKSPI